MDNSTKTKIFINYRRKDIQQPTATAIFACLTGIYGDIVFCDNECIDYGEIIPEKIATALENCEVFMPIIGPNWDSNKYLPNLNKPKDYVRWEIEQAKAKGLYIIPVLMNRDDMPDETNLPDYLKQGVFDRLAIKLDEDPTSWDYTFRSAHDRYKTSISFKPRAPVTQQELDEEHQKLAYCLNHSNEIQSIKNARKNRQVLFSGSGKNEQELIYFAKRCSVSLEHTFIGILPGARVHQISWDFNELTPDEYQSKLCHQVAQAVPASFNSATVFPSLENLKAHFNTLESGQSYIFWAIRENGFSPLQTKQATQIWWDTWHSLLAEREKQNVIVFLFTEPGWFAWLNIMSRFRKRKDQHIGDFKGRIHKRHLDTWRLNFFNSYLEKPENKRQFDQDCLKNIFKEKYPKPSFLRQSLIFDQTVEFLESALKEAYRPTHKSDNT